MISNLQKTYPKDKMDEISTSFCFICLLHLANERGLKLGVGEDDDGDSMAVVESHDEELEDANVGNIWGLKVMCYQVVNTKNAPLLNRLPLHRCIGILRQHLLHDYASVCMKKKGQSLFSPLGYYFIDTV